MASKRKRDDIDESTRSWSFVLFKDYVAANGDKLLKQLLPSGAPIIAPQYVFKPGMVEDFKSKFSKYIITYRRPFLWRLEAVMEDGAGHHFLISVNPAAKKITILDPAVSSTGSALYSSDIERVQIKAAADRFKYTVKDAPIPTACQPIVNEKIDYLDTSCQTWSLLMGVESVVDEALPTFQFKNPDKKEDLDKRVNVLKSGISRILPLIPSSSRYDIQASASSDVFAKLSPGIKKLYSDSFIVENMRSMLLPENQHELVSDYVGYKKWAGRRKTYRKKYSSRRKTRKITY
jgi:hypothetical protein